MSIAVSFFVYLLELYGSSLNMFASIFQQQRKISHSKGRMLFDFSTFAYVVIVFGIPLHELAIYPLASNWIRSTLKRVGITVFGTIIVASVALSVDMIVHAHTIKQQWCACL